MVHTVGFFPNQSTAAATFELVEEISPVINKNNVLLEYLWIFKKLLKH